MTYLRPDNKKGLGLDVPGPEEPSYFAGSDTPRPHRWWLRGRGLVSSMVMFVVWSSLAVVRLMELAQERHVVSGDWLIIVFWGVLALGTVPSIIFYAWKRCPSGAAAAPELSDAD